MANIYLMHPRDFDPDKLDAICDPLSRNGHNLNGSHDVQLGDEWETHLRRNLNDAEISIVLLDEFSEDSEAFESEIEYAVGYARATGNLGLIPVVFGESKLPASLRKYQALRVDSEDIHASIERIVDAIPRILGSRAARFEIRDEKQTKIKVEAGEFIATSLTSLGEREHLERKVALIWYTLAGLSLVVGVAFSFWRLSNFDVAGLTIYSTLEVAITSVVAVGLTLAFSRLSYSLGKSHMVEALRNADRRHAISFGEFYLNAKGDEIDWDELKEAFQHWNIDKGSAFIEQNGDDFDPRLFEKAIEFAKILNKK